MDLYLFNLINGFAGKWAWLDFLGVFFAQYFEYILLFTLFSLLTLKFKKYFRIVFLSLISAVFSRFAVADFIRWLWFRSRPFVGHNVNLLVSHNASEASFPSGHASFYFALSTVIFLFNKKLGIFFYISSFLICLGRVFVGIHWPSDILAGAIVGALVGVIFYSISHKFLKLEK
jgi:undecaprenyl-diphosphatase